MHLIYAAGKLGPRFWQLFNRLKVPAAILRRKQTDRFERSPRGRKGKNYEKANI